MRAVLDTNILCSALLTPGGPTDRVYRAWREGRFQLLTSDEQLEEFRRVTRYPRLKPFIEPPPPARCTTSCDGSRSCRESSRRRRIGEEVRVWEWAREAFPRVIKTIYRQGDLERRIATLTLWRYPQTITIDNRIVERSYQHDFINALTEEIQCGRRKLGRNGDRYGQDSHRRGADQAAL